MFERFATDEVLNSTLQRLRGKYGVLRFKERRKENPDQNKLAYYQSRADEIGRLMFHIFKATLEVKNETIKKYAKELRDLTSDDKDE